MDNNDSASNMTTAAGPTGTSPKRNRSISSCSSKSDWSSSSSLSEDGERDKKFLKLFDKLNSHMSIASYPQQRALLDFLVENRETAKESLGSAHRKEESKRKWNEASVKLNPLGVVQRDGNGWAVYWADKKRFLNKSCAKLARSHRRNGGAPEVVELTSLTRIDRRFVAVMGGLRAILPSTMRTYKCRRIMGTEVELDDDVPESPPPRQENSAVPTHKNGSIDGGSVPSSSNHPQVNPMAGLTAAIQEI